jgi:hypothetical protein
MTELNNSQNREEEQANAVVDNAKIDKPAETEPDVISDATISAEQEKEPAERIELAAHREAAKKQQRTLWQSQAVRVFISLGEEAKGYLENLVKTQQPIKKNLKKLLALKEEYGAYALVLAIKKASLHNAYGAHYIENILYQEMSPKQCIHRSGSKMKN